MKNFGIIPMIIIEVFVCIALILVGTDHFPDVHLGKNVWIAYIGAFGWGSYALSNLQKLLKDRNDS